MRVFNALTPYNKKTAVALGFFDGIHLGHRAVIKKAVEAEERGLVPAAFTFSSTPKSKDKNSQLLTCEEKTAILEKLGIKVLYILDFEELKDTSPEVFVRDILKGVFSAEEVFCGYNYRFGRHKSGNTDTLKRLGEELGIKVGVCDPVKLDDIIVCSTEIRNRLKNGDIKEADRLLGYDFGLNGKALKGSGIGSKLSTPTINQKFADGIILPKFGVYASVVTLDGKTYAGVTNIGVKPTVGAKNLPNCETWLPEFKGGDLYGKTVDVRLKEFIRPEKKFSTLEELKSAIRADGLTALEILRRDNYE